MAIALRLAHYRSAVVAGRVLKGAQEACAEAGIPLAGGHSIDAPEPIFGLAVTGMAKTMGKPMLLLNPALFLTKPLGVGIVTTNQPYVAQEEHIQAVQNQMGALNEVGLPGARSKVSKL